MGSSGVRECLHDLTAYLALLITITTIGPLLFGFHLAELNAPQDVITCKKEAVTLSQIEAHLGIPPTLPQCIPMDETEFAVISSIFTLGGLIGALCAGPISTTYGRLLPMRISALFYIVGSVVESVAGSIAVFSFGRLLSGIGAGCSLVVVPLYISEIAPAQQRGVYGVMTQITINFGILIAQTLGYFWSRGSMWRFILATGSGIGAVLLVGLLFVPESPPWTAVNKDTYTARLVLQKIRGRDADIDDEVRAWDLLSPPDSDGESEVLLGDTNVSARSELPPSKSVDNFRHHIGFFEIMKDPFYRPAIIAVIGIMCAQQLTGINSVMMYSVSLLSELFPTSSALLTIFISIANFMATVLCAPLPDLLGRKGCLLVSISGMGFSSVAMAFSIFFEIKILSAISVLFFVIFFAAGLGPIPFIIASELVGHEAKGATQSWALGANWIATFLVAQFFPIINTALGGRGLAYFGFAGMALFFTLFVAWNVPETKGKKDADEVWGRGRRID